MTKADFLEKIEKTETCWVWLGAPDPNGYGAVKYFGIKKGAHVISWKLYKGDNGDKWVLHKCDNRLCVNPDHLFLGDRSDNMIDCVIKERLHKAKIDVALVKLIKRKIQMGIYCKSIAKELKLPIDLVKNIKSGKSWRHVII